MNNPNLLYIAKKIQELAETHSVIGISCPSTKEALEKSKVFLDIVKVLKEANINLLSVNFDENCTEDVDFDGTKHLNNLSYPIDLIPDADKYDLMLINMRPILGNEYLLEQNGTLNAILLQVEYGNTSYKKLEAVFDVLKENSIDVLGVIADR